MEWVRENGLMEYGGATLNAFCEHIDIDDTTFRRWLQNPTFATAIKEAKEDFKNGLELKIVSSLAKSAQGFDVEDVTTDYVDGKDGKPKVRHQVRKKHHIPPNTGAAIFLLTNLNGEVWKNTQRNEVEMTNPFEEMMKTIVEEEENDVE